MRNNKKSVGKSYRELAVSFDKLNRKLPNECKKEKIECLKRAQQLGFIVGTNGNKIEIHEQCHKGYSMNTLCVQLLLDNQGAIIVNSDHLWKIAEIQEMRELGYDM